MTTEKPVRTVKKSSALVVAAFVALTGTLLLCVGAEGLAKEGNAGTEAAGPHTTGLRSARFGMSRPETLKAMQRDFRLRRADIATQQNDEDRTSSLVATVEDIFPGSGPARVVYIHGYKKKKTDSD